MALEFSILAQRRKVPDDIATAKAILPIWLSISLTNRKNRAEKMEPH